MTFSQILNKAVEGQNLTPEEADLAFSLLMDGELTPAQAGAFLMTLRCKGESAEEMAAAVRSALSRAREVDGILGEYMDIVGTGGDGKKSFNCSTATALIMAGMGYRIVKHGNRAVSSSSGTADALEGLGYPLDLDAEGLRRSLEQSNFAFAFAPNMHPCFKNIGPIRRELGVRTLFNLLGPLINPSKPSLMLMGVAKPELLPMIAEVLSLGSVHRALVICGAGGYDEATCFGKADALLVEDGQVSPFALDPAELGFEAPASEAELRVENKEEALAVLKQILQGKGPKPMMDMVALNVALALHLFSPELPLQACVSRARMAMADAVGMNVLQHWKNL